MQRRHFFKSGLIAGAATMLHPTLLAQKGAANKVMKEDVFHLNYAFHDGMFKIMAAKILQIKLGGPTIWVLGLLKIMA